MSNTNNIQNTIENNTSNTPKGSKKRTNRFSTHSGHPLTPNEARFIDRYIETSNGQQSVIDAGYKSKFPSTYANSLLNKDYIASEIAYRFECAKNDSIADAEEIMQYFSDVMRGKIKDQFGLEASLGERTKAAVELAKRQIDIPNKLKDNEPPELKITLDWAMPTSVDIQPAADIDLDDTCIEGDDGK